MAAYATADEYRILSGDNSSDEKRIKLMLEDLSAELDAECGICESTALTNQALVIARSLVCDAARKALVPPSFDGIGPVVGATQASFSANSFTGSYQLQNPSGSAYFDRAKLRRFKQLLGGAQKVGFLSC